MAGEFQLEPTNVLPVLRTHVLVVIVAPLLALADLKLIPISLMPLGKEIVPVDQAREDKIGLPG